MNLAVFYTGDVRHNQFIATANHNKLITALKVVKIYNFTKSDPERGLCPYDDGEPDTVYRRGQGGAIQVWDFCQGVDRTTEDIVLRLRTDIWFTDSSIDVIVNELKLMIDNQADITYFGSDWVNQTVGVINLKLPVHIDHDPVVQDFVILAQRSKIKSTSSVIDDLAKVIPNKRRSGNKTFRYIIPTEPGVPGFRNQLAIVHRILCQIWLIRQDYVTYPTDNIVCRDYIQSYIVDDKAKQGKKNLVYPHPMQDGVNWWRKEQGWGPKDIIVGEWWAWQSE
jgi:hypothetical protein